MALSMMGSMIGFAEKQAQADAQNQAAHNNLMQQYTQNSIASLQEQTAASDKLFLETVQAKTAQSQYLASAEGMGGSIIGSILRDKKATEAHNTHNINTNFENSVQQRQYELQGLRTQADGRSKSGPSLLATGLEIGSTYREYNP